MRKRFVFWGILSFIMVLGLAVIVSNKCFDSQEKQVTQYLWHDLGDNGNKWFDEIGEKFTKLHPNVMVYLLVFSSHIHGSIPSSILSFIKQMVCLTNKCIKAWCGRGHLRHANTDGDFKLEVAKNHYMIFN